MRLRAQVRNPVKSTSKIAFFGLVALTVAACCTGVAAVAASVRATTVSVSDGRLTHCYEDNRLGRAGNIRALSLSLSLSLSLYVSLSHTHFVHDLGFSWLAQSP